VRTSGRGRSPLPVILVSSGSPGGWLVISIFHGVWVVTGRSEYARRGYNKAGITTEELIDKVKALPAEEQASVARYIDELERRHAGSSQILQAAEQFADEHPELLRRLSQ
jgi:hypothetical protein